MQCPRCQQDNPVANAQFCPRCGAPVKYAAESGTSAASYADLVEQQAATSEVLRIISASPTDAQPVFNAIARSAMRLCEGAFSVVARYDGELMHLGAHAHTTAEGTNYIQQNLPKRPGRETMLGRAILGGRV